MLTLTRREGEYLILHIDGIEPIQIKLPHIMNCRKARISADAPESIRI